MQTRRSRTSMLTVILTCAVLTLTACSTDWITEVEQIVAALIPAVSNIIGLVAAAQGRGVSAADLQVIQATGTRAGADLQLIQSLIVQYRKADVATRPGLLNQIQTAINTVQTNLNGILPTLHIKDTATQAKIMAVVGMVLSEVESLGAILPRVNSNGSPQTMAMVVGHVKERPPLSAREFVSSYNATMTAKTGNKELDFAASSLGVHLHGKLARRASAGILQ